MKRIIFTILLIVLMSSCSGKEYTVINTTPTSTGVGVRSKSGHFHITNDTLSIGGRRFNINNRW